MEEESLLFMMSSYVMSNIVYLILNLLVTNLKKKEGYYMEICEAGWILD